MMLKPIQKKRVSDLIVEQIDEMIASKKLQPGQILSSERELVKELQVSRASLREALRILESMGVIEIKPGRGIFVADVTNSLFAPFEVWLESHRESLIEQFEVRLVIEPDAAYFAAQRASHESILAMKKSLEYFIRYKNDNNTIGMIEYDSGFHNLIAKATNNRTLSVLMETITNSLLCGWKASLHIPSRVENSVKEHSEIFFAIENRLPEKASRMMKIHLEHAIDDLRKYGLVRFSHELHNRSDKIEG
jgi:GntR family transcriptional repressor for pyruvate dehydrogenase complex